MCLISRLKGTGYCPFFILLAFSSDVTYYIVRRRDASDFRKVPSGAVEKKRVENRGSYREFLTHDRLGLRAYPVRKLK